MSSESNPHFADMLPHEYFPLGTVLHLPVAPASGVVEEKAK
ncbi:hypothetical protein [Paraburkholderia caledonica]|nr:hypothetical protein [Paraburkholderia caledonica]